MPIQVPLITGLYAGLCTLLMLVLGARVSMNRRRHKVGVGTGGNRDLELAVRVHGNAVETIPVGLLLLLLFELNGAAVWAVHAAGAIFTIARISHASGLSSSAGVTQRRFLGMAATWSVMAVLAIALVVQTAVGLLS
ncbi:MAG: MAPEG family protein [Pseudomonadota bacterium]